MTNRSMIVWWILAGVLFGGLVGVPVGFAMGWIIVGFSAKGDLAAVQGALFGALAGVLLGGGIGGIRGARGGQSRAPTRAILVGGILWLFSLGLILPAFQLIHDAARIRLCALNLYHLGIALYGYQDHTGAFPAGTIGHDHLPPEKRLSWIAEMLPFMNEAALDQALDKTMP